MDGLETAAEIGRRERAGRRTPIIALTADARPADRERCLAAGMDDFLAKPVDRAELAAAPQRWAPADRPAAADAHGAGAAEAAEDDEPIDLRALEWVDELRELGDAGEVPELFGIFFAETERRLVAARACLAQRDQAALGLGEEDPE